MVRTDPIESADAHFLASEVTNPHIIQAMREKEIFSLQDHITNQKGEIRAEEAEGRNAKGFPHKTFGSNAHITFLHHQARVQDGSVAYNNVIHHRQHQTVVI
jgi:2-keto-3-deoxy-6-phosphogluconate aldolase